MSESHNQIINFSRYTHLFNCYRSQLLYELQPLSAYHLLLITTDLTR